MQGLVLRHVLLKGRKRVCDRKEPVGFRVWVFCIEGFETVSVVKVGGYGVSLREAGF